MFNLGASEIVMTLLLALLFVTPAGLAKLGVRFGRFVSDLTSPRLRLVRVTQPSALTWPDWLLLACVVSLGVLAATVGAFG